MKQYVRTVLFLGVLGVALSLSWGIEWARNGFFWVIMMYLVIGSVTGGVRRVTSRFTGRKIPYSRSGLGYSWFVLTMWGLRWALGVTPKQRAPKESGGK
jgi:hypothetical protein